MMKMDGRDSAECQNWEKRDINVIFGKVFKSQKDKKLLQCFFSNKKGRQKCEMQNFGPATIFFEISFRERNFSLKIRRIRPSAVSGTRRKAVLRGAAYAWVPDL